MSVKMFDKYTKFSESRLVELALPEELTKFLAHVGLPTWCSPNMHFGEVGESWVLLPTIEIGAKRYLGLGEDRDDNVVAVDLQDYTMWVITGRGETLFLARNVMDLSQDLHHFQSCVDFAVERDSAAFTENRIPATCLEPFILWVYKENPQAIQAGSFWHGVLLWLGVPNPSQYELQH